MRTENKDSEKDLNANPESKLNTNKPVSKPERFPDGHEAQDEIVNIVNKDHPGGVSKKKKKDDDIELLAGEVSGTVSSRDTGSNPTDIAGVQDLDRGMRRAKRR